MQGLPNYHYTKFDDQDRLAFDLLKNFQKEFDSYKKNHTGLIAEYMKNKNSNVKYIKMKSGYEALGTQTGTNLSGYAAVKYSTTSFYVGEYKDNKKNGFGYHNFPNGLVYKGEYVDDKKVAGVVLDPNNNNFLVYVGGWGSDTYHGQGRLSRKNGQYYHGNFDQGKFQGKGMMWWPNNDRYDGDFDSNERSGNGVFKFSNGDIYEGQFLHNEFEGRGRYFWNSGDVFEGDFKNGKMENGDMKYSIGVIGTGKWDGDYNSQNYSLPAKKDNY
jgi:hypothetical protein